MKKSQSVASWLYNPNKHYADEHMDISNPASRCNTLAMKKTHTENMTRAKADADKIGVTTSTPGVLGEAYRDYLNNLSLVWGAMEEPYCGFGAFGMVAVKKSYEKSILDIRKGFLDTTRKALGVAVNTKK